MPVGGGKERTPAEKLKLLDDQTIRAAKTRTALVKAMEDDLKASEKAEKDRQIAKRIREDTQLSDQLARNLKARALPEVGAVASSSTENVIDFTEDNLEQTETVQIRLKSLEHAVAKLVSFKKVTQTDLIASITDIRTEANAQLSLQFVSCDTFKSKIAQVEGDLRTQIDPLKKKKIERSVSPTELEGSASRKRSAN